MEETKICGPCIKLSYWKIFNNRTYLIVWLLLIPINLVGAVWRIVNAGTVL